MTADEIVDELRPLGSESYKRILLNHGVREPVLGVKIEALKTIQKRVKQDYRLALELYDTGIYDAMYLAGLIADAQRMTRADLRRWLKRATCGSLCEYTIPGVAADGPHGLELAREWIESPKEDVAAAGWATLSAVVAVRDDAELDLPELKRLLKRVQQTLHQQPNHVRYVMNGFVIAVGSYVGELTELALQVAGKIGVVSVDMGRTACQVPDATAYIQKVQQRGTIGKKRKTARC
jgi:3-methyladenine DNA glycosylase AlkD